LFRNGVMSRQEELGVLDRGPVVELGDEGLLRDVALEAECAVALLPAT